MTAAKRANPYSYLMTRFREYVDSVRYRKTRLMFCYPRDKLHDSSWNLTDLWERTKAADQLGYSVQLLAMDDKLYVQYIEKLPDVPLDMQ